MIKPEWVSDFRIIARTFNWVSRLILARANHAAVLGRLINERVGRKRSVLKRLSVLPPWPFANSPWIHGRKMF